MSLRDPIVCNLSIQGVHWLMDSSTVACEALQWHEHISIDNGRRLDDTHDDSQSNSGTFES